MGLIHQGYISLGRLKVNLIERVIGRAVVTLRLAGSAVFRGYERRRAGDYAARLCLFHLESMQVFTAS